MKQEKEPFVEWPEVSLDEIEKIEIDNRPLRVFYQSFFMPLRISERITQIIIRTFFTVLKGKTN